MKRDRSNERGIALIIVMFMVLTMSLVGASLMFVSRTETLSSLNYQTVSQTRYAAESGIMSATNFLVPANALYTAPCTGCADDLANYDMTKQPVQWNNAAVVLSSDPSVASNYPVAAVQALFLADTAGTLTAGTGTSSYVASATLESMSTFTDAFTGLPVTLQTWQINGTGSIAGAGSASVQVTATLERGSKPAYQYAAFATNNGCDALKFGGGATTGSYNSTSALVAGAPVTSASGGNVGTNGNLDELGNSTTINGSLSTPRSGVGTCSASNVTALTQTNGATVTGGVTQLSQSITYPTPPAISPAPPTSNNSFTKNSNAADCTGIAGCSVSGTGDGITIHPATSSTVTTLGNVSVSQSGSVLHLGAGIYDINSISVGSNAKIVVDSGPVIFKVAGSGINDSQSAISLSSGSISNSTYNPQNLQFVYGGTAQVNVAGGAGASTVIYAPNATASFTGGGTIYGAVITAKVTDMGGAAIYYDNNLTNSGKTDGNPIMDQFTWKNY